MEEKGKVHSDWMLPDGTLDEKYIEEEQEK